LVDFEEEEEDEEEEEKVDKNLIKPNSISSSSS
jgi:hypothetical protein